MSKKGQECFRVARNSQGWLRMSESGQELCEWPKRALRVSGLPQTLSETLGQCLREREQQRYFDLWPYVPLLQLSVTNGIVMLLHRSGRITVAHTLRDTHTHTDNDAHDHTYIYRCTHETQIRTQGLHKKSTCFFSTLTCILDSEPFLYSQYSKNINWSWYI